jgi:hypothetical protein
LEFLSIGTVPHDGIDEQVYSAEIPVPPFSFLNPVGRLYSNKQPPPTYLKKGDLVYNEKIAKEELFKGLAIPDEGGLKCVDKEILNRQKGVVASLLAQVATCFFQKGGFVRVSLPVRVFEPRSTLDKIADPWRTAPFYLTKAANTTDPILRMKYVIAYAISGLYLSITQLKPFNPLLGETMEAGFEDGTLIYAEHTSHHPPISSFIIYGKDDLYQLSGRYNYKVKFSANSLVATQAGPNNIRFKDGHEVMFKLPGGKISGLLVGSRLTFYTGPMRFYDKRNNIKAVVIFDHGYKGGILGSRAKGCKRDEFKGILYKWKADTPKKKIKFLKELNDIQEPICEISGSWLSNLKIGDEEFWNINTFTPSRMWYTNSPIPSDWRFREDLLWLRRNSIPIADVWKVELEIQQRWDRSLREKTAKERDKINNTQN